MAFTKKTRYGAMEYCPDDADCSAVVELLIRELETERFEEPDDEHCAIAIGYGDFVLTLTTYGLMILEDMQVLPNGQPSPELFKRAASRDEATLLLTHMARGQVVEVVRAATWVLRDQVTLIAHEPRYTRPREVTRVSSAPASAERPTGHVFHGASELELAAFKVAVADINLDQPAFVILAQAKSKLEQLKESDRRFATIDPQKIIADFRYRSIAGVLASAGLSPDETMATSGPRDLRHLHEPVSPGPADRSSTPPASGQDSEHLVPYSVPLSDLLILLGIGTALVYGLSAVCFFISPMLSVVFNGFASVIWFKVALPLSAKGLGGLLERSSVVVKTSFVLLLSLLQPGLLVLNYWMSYGSIYAEDAVRMGMPWLPCICFAICLFIGALCFTRHEEVG